MAVLKTILMLVVGLAGTIAIIVIGASGMEAQVGIPSQLIVSTEFWERGYVFARGTFTIDNERSAFPLQVSEIECRREEKSCIEARAEIIGGGLLNVELEKREISLWNDSTILYRDDARCAQYVYTFDRANKRVIGTRTKKQNVSGCESIDSKPLTLSLVNGFDVWQRLNNEARARVSPFMWGGTAAWWVVLLIFAWSRRPRAPAKQ